MPRPVTKPAARFGDRLAQAVERTQSQVLLGLDPDPGRLLPDALGSVEGGASTHRRARRRRSACPLRRARRCSGAGVCGGKAPAGLLRAARRTGLGGAGRCGRSGAGRRLARGGGRQAGGRSPHGRRLRPGAGRGDRDAVGPGRGPGRRRGHGQPAARAGLARADRHGGPRARRRGVRAGADLEPGRGRAAGRHARRWAAAARAPGRDRGTSSGATPWGTLGSPTSARSWRRPSPR